jgi:hypothetical protein
MTRMEITGQRSLVFSQWIRDRLPDSSTGFMVTDVDFFLYNYKTRKVMVLEVKTRNCNIKTWQHKFYELLGKWLNAGIMAATPEWEYLGIHLLQFENLSFEDGKIYLDRNEVSEGQLITFLSLL